MSCFTCHIWSSTSHFTVDSLHTPRYFTLLSSHCTLCTSHSTNNHIATVVSGQEFYSLFLDINVTTFTYINIVHKTRNSNLHPRNSWQTTSQYYFPVHTTWHYTACTQYYFALQFPVLLCTTKLAQSTPQYYFVLQSLHQVVSSMLQFAAPKPDGSRRQSKKKTILKHFLKGILKGKLLAPNLRKSADKWLSQPGCSHSNTIYNLQLQKTIVLRMQPRRQATLRQPLQCDLQRLSCKSQ